MRRFRLVVTFIVLGLCHAGADEEVAPHPLLFTSKQGDVLFAMVPPEEDSRYQVVREPFGVAYRLTKEGTLAELYRTSGWYSFDVFISNDGRSVIQMGPWNRGQRPDKGHLALAFHRDGKLIKSYSTSELVRSPEKVVKSVSHYTWLENVPNKPGYDSKFELTTFDGWIYEFDVSTGEIRSTKSNKGQPDGAANGSQPIRPHTNQTSSAAGSRR